MSTADRDIDNDEQSVRSSAETARTNVSTVGHLSIWRFKFAYIHIPARRDRHSSRSVNIVCFPWIVHPAHYFADSNVTSARRGFFDRSRRRASVRAVHVRTDRGRSDRVNLQVFSETFVCRCWWRVFSRLDRVALAAFRRLVCQQAR